MHILQERVVDQGLVIPAPSLLHEAAKVLQDAVVETIEILVLPGSGGTTGPRLACVKSISRYGAAAVFFIAYPLPSIGCLRRDDADDIWLTIGVDRHQQVPETTHAQCDEALLAFTFRVFARQGEVIFEHGHGFGETDPMCGQIRFGFGGVPFILHVLNVWTIVFCVKDDSNR